VTFGGSNVDSTALSAGSLAFWHPLRTIRQSNAANMEIAGFTPGKGGFVFMVMMRGSSELFCARK
jgi:hypothetical protein